MAGSSASRRRELRTAVADLTVRGLTEGARWAAELLVGLPETDNLEDSGTQQEQREEPTIPTGGRCGGPDVTGRAHEDIYLLCKAYFDCKEYRRAAAHLRGIPGDRAQFLRCYSTYLAGLKQREEERVEKAGPLGKADVKNQELEALELELLEGYEDGTLDPFCTYLYGLVLVDQERKGEAAAVLVRSVTAYPCNWSAWQALSALVRDQAGVIDGELPTHWTADFFMAGLCLEMQRDEDGLMRLQDLYNQFPNSTHIIMQSAIAHYNLRNFDDAQALFGDLLENDEFRIEGMDIYSNILYVKECFAELSHLAHKASQTDKYRPETCCIIGNYYSLKAQHEKAVTYFRRALKLNNAYLSAWTLMGHEYVEMKNMSAAIDAYRRAVDINPRDYRAWYGLGQAYEVMSMPYYALYYFRRATQLRPHDARMWCAMGQCYENEQLAMDDAAVHCYKRAVSNTDREGIALNKLAKIHERQGQFEQAAHYYTLNLERIDADQATGSDALAALSFLAQFYTDRGMYRKAEQYCMRLLDFGGPQRDKAGALLRELHSLQQRQAADMVPPSPASPGSDLDLSPG